MKIASSLSRAMTVLCFAASALVSATALAQSTQSDWDYGKWQFTGSIYGFVPTINMKVNYPGDLGSTDTRVSERQVLDHLKMGFMGALDAHNGSWGIFNDLIYANFGGIGSRTKDFSIGNIGIPAGATAELNFGLKVTIWTLAGEYRVASDPAWTVDLLAGARMLYLKPTLGYSITGDLGPVVLPGRSGNKEVSENRWDGIVGVKGRYAFGDDRKWFAPFYLDVGTGQTKLTWQIAGGVGYAYHWGEVFATYRYLDWNAKSGKSVQDLNLGGPMIGVTFRW